MQKRNLGTEGSKVSAIGIGAMSFSDVYGRTSRENSHAILRRAIELGIDHIDTSNVYGQGLSEQVIGEFLRNLDGPNPFFIATKAAISRDPDTGERTVDNSREHLAAELDGSLKRLGIDHVDLFYVHRRDPSIEIEAVTQTLVDLAGSGKIRSFGFSEIAPSSLERARSIGHVAAVQSEYSLATRSPELGLVQRCRSIGTALVAFSPVGRGLLTDRPPDRGRASASAILKDNPRFIGENLRRNCEITDRFRALAAEFGTSAAALSIAWLLHQGPHVIPIPGTRSTDHLSELAAGTQLELSQADLSRIEDVLPVGWAHGDRYSRSQWIGPERYC